MDSEKYHKKLSEIQEENIKIYDKYIKENRDAEDMRSWVWRIINWSFSAGYDYLLEELLEFTKADEIIRGRVRREI